MNKINLIFALLYSTSIIFLGLSESETISITSFETNDKLAHFIFYFLFFIIWHNSFNYLFGKKALVYLFIFAFIFSIFIEIGQKYLTLSRNAELLDIVSNLIGIQLAYIYFKLKKRNI